MVPEFEQMMVETPPGQLSPVFQSQFGWHFLRVEETREADMSDQFRELHAIDDTMVFINGCQTYWRKQKPVFGEEMRRGWYEQFNAARKSRLNDPKPGSAEEIGILGVPRAYAN